jgi:hypothetical protein
MSYGEFSTTWPMRGDTAASQDWVKIRRSWISLPGQLSGWLCYSAASRVLAAFVPHAAVER